MQRCSYLLYFPLSSVDNAMELSCVGELSLVSHIREKFGRKAKNLIVGIGDDAAVITPQGRYCLLTTDMMVEGVHFDRRFVTPYQLGFKLLSVNVSDVYAMGGTPAYALLDIAVPKRTSTAFIDDFFCGLENATNIYHIALIGGDVSSSRRGSVFSATLIGHTERYVQRTGAREGDRVYVTGPLGNSACGLALLKKFKKTVPLPLRCSGSGGGRSAKTAGMRELSSWLREVGISWKTAAPLFRRHLMPEARDPKGFCRSATSMIDISDGLLIDLTRLCNESNVGVRLFEDKIPISAEMKRAASRIGVSPLSFALSGGEDYELLFTSPPGKRVAAIHIGDIIKSKRVIVGKEGKERAFSAEGYQHFGT